MPKCDKNFYNHTDKVSAFPEAPLSWAWLTPADRCKVAKS